MRKLASLQIVKKIEPIQGADRIELAHILGWQCVVGKGQFKENDLAVYFEIDSFLPIREEFEILRKSSYVNSPLMGEGFRIRTAKFKGQLSQGLLLPVSEFPELDSTCKEEGTDVTTLLGVRKWEIEEFTTNDGITIAGTLPPSIPKTEEVRIQAMPSLLDAFARHEYYITTKMDGSSHSISIDEQGHFHVAGRNYEYKSGSFYNFVYLRRYEERMRSYIDKAGLLSLTIQGELCGPGIQKNRLKLDKLEWYVFTILIDNRRIGLQHMTALCGELGMVMVPVEETGGNLKAKYPDVDALLTRAEGNYPSGGKKEGIVIRPTTPIWSTKLGGYLSMKVINNGFLLKQGE